MARSSRAPVRQRPARPRGSPKTGTDALAAATVEAATLYWRWLEEEFPRYAKAMSSEFAGLKGRRNENPEAAGVRIARLTQAYSEVLRDLSRRILEQTDRAPHGSKRATPRRRQGRVID
jgi:hypothetical protein